jgi:hypothetical protein
MKESAAPPAVVITGHAYQRRATLEVIGDTLTWRAQRGQLQPIAENIVTTLHDVREVRWVEHRWSALGILLAGLSIIWCFTESVAFGAASFAFATAAIVWRQTKPRRWLVLALDGHRLVLKVAPASAPDARKLAARIERRLVTGELPAIPPTLP